MFHMLKFPLTCVPHGVPHHLSRPGLRLHQLELDARLGHRAEGRRLPVRLGVLLPHDRVELVVVLESN